MQRLPELESLRNRRQLIRIPDELDVPLTPRIQRLIDSGPFRRLASITQLGLVSLVYPGATHSRFEHSLGVYRNTLLFLDQLSTDPRFVAVVGPHDAERLLVASLLHDLGHWPFCHPIEDLKLQGVPEHEEFVAHWLAQEELGRLLADDWDLKPTDVVRLLSGKAQTPAESLLRSILSGPIDVDKLDYLYRDSLHAGIPYGRNFDRNRLMNSLCVDSTGTSIALDEKAKTAAEMMVFARYVMFSEVYWHHAVRSATAMLQRAFYELFSQGGNWREWFLQDEASWVRTLEPLAARAGAQSLWDGLFGSHRRLYKRMAQFSVFEGRELYTQLARRPYPWLVECSRQLSELLSQAWGQQVEPLDVLIDAPPVGLEVEFKVDIRVNRGECYRPLGEISPVVHSLATRQFDDYVKRVRVFVHPRWSEHRNSTQSGFPELLQQAIERTRIAE